MRLKTLIPVLGLIFFTGAVSCSRSPDRYLVGAYYYHWYPRNFRKQGCLRRLLSPPQQPVLGYYSSSDPEVAGRHIAWCSRYGVDFLALDWWPDRPEQNRAIEEGFLAAENIGDIRFCIFYNSWGLGRSRYGTIAWSERSSERFIDDLRRIAARFFHHPSYLRINGRPVVFLYLTRLFQGNTASIIERLRSRLQEDGYDPYIVADEVFWWVLREDSRAGGRPQWSEEPQLGRIRCFDAITPYNMYESRNKRHIGYASESTFIADVSEQYRRYRKAAGRDLVFVPGVIPGYNDRGVRLAKDNYAIPRSWTEEPSSGYLLSRMLDRVGLPFVDPEIPLLMITTWNEWNEDTAIEPLRPAPATRRDHTPSGSAATQGYAYEGFGTRYLEIIRDKVVAVSGRIVDDEGNPRVGESLRARSGWRTVARARSDSDGYYRFSRLKMPPGDYTVEFPAGGAARRIQVVSGRTATGVDFRGL